MARNDMAGDQVITVKFHKGSFNNNVDKNRVWGGEGVIKKSMLGHVTKGRYHVK